MSNDCGCTKKIVDKIYIENNCCNKKEQENNCNKTRCTTCGKQIDLIDSDLYAENIYNYQPDSSFNSQQIIIKESDLLSSINNPTVRDEVYTLLQEANNITNSKIELLIQLKRSYTGHFGLKCIATIREDDGKYTVVYSRQFRDYTVDENSSKKIKTFVYVYTNNLESATFNMYDITSYTCEEIIEILSQYAKKSWVEEFVYNYLTQNYYNKTDIDNIISNLNLGEDCLFEQSTGTLSTVRKETDQQKKSIASGDRSFAMQNSTAEGENSIAFQNSIVTGDNSVGFQGSIVNGSNSLGIINIDNYQNTIDENSNNSIVGIGSTVENSNNSIGLCKSKIQRSDNSFALMKGKVSNSEYSISIGDSSLSGYDNNSSNDPIKKPRIDGSDPQFKNNISLFGGTASGRNSIAVNFGGYCSASNRGSISIGTNIFNSGFYGTAIGYELDNGRYQKIDSNNNTVYQYEESANTKGQYSYLFGYTMTNIGPYNILSGRNHFIKGNHSASFGNSNIISGENSSHNLVFGDKCIIENANSSLAGGFYSAVLPKDRAMTNGSISLGDSLIIDDIYLEYAQSMDPDKDGQIYLKMLCKDPLNENSYNGISILSELGKRISHSNMIVRNGTTKYVGTFSFYLRKDNQSPIYPGIGSFKVENNIIYISLTGVKNISTLTDKFEYQEGTTYFKCSARFSEYSNKAVGSGSVSLGTGNFVESERGICIGTGNTVLSNYGVSIGNFNNTNSYSDTDQESYDILFSIGGGRYDSNNQEIHRKNIFEIVKGTDNTVEDINFVIGDKWYSMKELIEVSQIEAHDVNDNITELTTEDINTPGINNDPNYTNGYVKISDTRVFDPDNVLPQTAGEDYV